MRQTSLFQFFPELQHVASSYLRFIILSSILSFNFNMQFSNHFEFSDQNQTYLFIYQGCSKGKVVAKGGGLRYKYLDRVRAGLKKLWNLHKFHAFQRKITVFSIFFHRIFTTPFCNF